MLTIRQGISSCAETYEIITVHVRFEFEPTFLPDDTFLL
jgi:hypothetical protein